MPRSKKIDIVTFKKSSGLLGGNYRSVFQGSGMEFQDLRMYEPGDDVKNIDWLNTAKHGKVFTKKYVEERELPALFLFNLGSSMHFGSGNIRKIDTLLNAFKIIGSALISAGDPFGFVSYADTVERFYPHKKGIMTYLQALNQILESKISTSDKIKSNIDLIITKLFNLKLKNNIIFVFSDELNIIETKKFNALCKMNDVVYIHISDNFENDLKGNGVANLSDGNTNIFLNLDSSKVDKYITLRKEQISAFRKFINTSKASFLPLDNSSNIFSEIYNFFKLRKKIIR